MNCEGQSSTGSKSGCKRITHAFDWPYSGIRIRTFTSKNYSYENVDAIRIQRRFSASFPVKTLKITVPKFSTKEKSGGYSVDSHSWIASTEKPKNTSLAALLSEIWGTGEKALSWGTQLERRRQRRKFVYLMMKNISFARFARAFFIFVHFTAILVPSTTWNDLFCRWVDDVSTWRQMLSLFF